MLLAFGALNQQTDKAARFCVYVCASV